MASYRQVLPVAVTGIQLAVQSDCGGPAVESDCGGTAVEGQRWRHLNFDDWLGGGASLESERNVRRLKIRFLHLFGPLSVPGFLELCPACAAPHVVPLSRSAKNC